ncbi:MAG: hypothetical protein JWN18_699 [Parcubacteria group bacterium]|nr:hypothetical protein [Parcubacteria group bacterium]
MQRYLIIAAAAIVTIGVGVVVYFYFFSGSPDIMVAPTGTSTLPAAGEGGTSVSDSKPTSPAASVSPRLVQISKGPVVRGEVVIDRKPLTASSSPQVVVQYLERQSGNVYSYLPHEKVLTRISNKTVPGIQSAAWLPDGSYAFVRYLSGDTSSIINSYGLAATTSAGFFLTQNLSGLAVSSSSLLTLASGVNGSVATLLHSDGSHPTTVFTTPLSSLHVSFAGKNRYLAYTKPSATLLGDAFLYTSSSNFSRVAGPLFGLVALASPKGNWVLVSYTANSTMQLELVNPATNQVIPLPIGTIADKCVWSADETSIYCGIPVDPSTRATYPDDWYQGALHFNDRIWKINVSGRYAELVLDFAQESKEALDAEALAIDPQATTLVFVNKNDGSLWSYSL